MKKFFLLALLIPALTVSCSDNPNEPTDGTKGSIRLRADLGAVVESRAPATTDMTVVLKGPSGTQQMAWPSDGMIRELAPGNYTVKLTTHTDGMPDPGFDRSYYEGTSGTLDVRAGETVQTTITCTQQNGGVFFEYVPELAAVYVVPTVTDAAGKSVAYPGKTADVGYFAPGTVKVTITIDGNPANINGKAFHELAVKPAYHWKVKFQKDIVKQGGIDITVDFEEVSIEEITLGIDGGGAEPPVEFALDNIFKAYYHAPYDTATPAEFEIDFDDMQLSDGFMVKGFCTNRPGDAYPLPAGNYVISGNPGAANTLRTGLLFTGVPTGTFGYIFTGTPISEFWLAESGTMSVAYDNDVMTVEITMSGKNHNGGAFEQRKYTYTGDLPTWSITQDGPPGDVVWEDIPEVEYVATGIVKEGIGPTTWNGYIYKMDNPAGKYLVITHWGGANNDNEPITLEYAQYIDFINGYLIVDDRQFHYGPEGYPGHWFSCFHTAPDNYRLNGGEFKVEFDPDLLTLNYAGNTVEWEGQTYDTWIAYYKFYNTYNRITAGYAPKLRLTDNPSPVLTPIIRQEMASYGLHKGK